MLAKSLKSGSKLLIAIIGILLIIFVISITLHLKAHQHGEKALTKALLSRVSTAPAQDLKATHQYHPHHNQKD